MTKYKGKAEMNKGEAVLIMIKADIMSYVVTAIFILFSSIILTYTDASPRLEGTFVIIGIIASAFLAGFDTAKIEDRNGYKWGAIGGVLYFIIFLILGTWIGRLSDIGIGTILLIAMVILVTSTIAGMISVNCEHSTSHRY